MDLSIIIVNYKNYELTDRCIKSILETLSGISYEIIVIDNDSPNESYIILKDRYTSKDFIKIIKNSSNSGFGSANNIAASQVNSNILLFINPDVIVLENSILNMYNRLIKSQDIGLIGCKLLNEDLTLQYSCRRFLKFNEFISARTPLKKLLKKSSIEYINSKYLMKDFDHQEEAFVDWVMGSCMLIRKELFEKIGGFGVEYFMYFEDVDLCYRIHASGNTVLYYPHAEMIHMHKQESIKSINKLTFTHAKSAFTFYSRSKL